MELNDVSRKEVQQGFPLRRAYFEGSPLITSGLANRSMDEVDQPALRIGWVYNVRRGVEQFCMTVRRLPNKPAFDPTIVVTTISTGGHLLLGLETAQALKQQFTRADFYAVTIVDEKLLQQQELIKALTTKQPNPPTFRFWLITDNRKDQDTNDTAVAMFFATVTQAHRVSAAEDTYNLLRSLYPLGDGKGIGVLHYWEQLVAVHRTPLPPFDYYIWEIAAVRAIVDGITVVRDKTIYQTIDLRTPLPNTRRIIIVNIALRHPYLEQLENQIRARLQADNWFTADPYRVLIFSSLGERLHMFSKWITVSVMLVEMAEFGIDALELVALADTNGTGGDNVNVLT